MSYKLKIIPTGDYQANAYILYEGSKACIIDPGHEGQVLLLELEGLELEAIILTHRHCDHVGAAQFIKDKTGAPIYIHEADLEAAKSPKEFAYTGVVNGFTPGPIKGADVVLKDGDEIKLSFTSLKVLHTPGHTTGGICLYNEHDIFTGDTLFTGSMGRTDFESGNQIQMFKSLIKLSKLNEGLKVYPGHGESTSIKKEKETNQFMRFACSHYKL